MKLGEYKGLHVKRPSLTVTEKEIDQVLKRKQSKWTYEIHTDGPKGSIEKHIEVQPLDDDFAKDFSDFDTMAEWRQDILQQLTLRKKQSGYKKMAKELLDMIIADSEFEIEDDTVEEMTELLIDDFLDLLEENNIPFDLYLKRSKKSEEEFYQEKQEEALRNIKEQFVLYTISEIEGLEDEDPAQQMQKAMEFIICQAVIEA